MMNSIDVLGLLRCKRDTSRRRPRETALSHFAVDNRDHKSRPKTERTSEIHNDNTFGPSCQWFLGQVGGKEHNPTALKIEGKYVRCPPARRRHSS